MRAVAGAIVVCTNMASVRRCAHPRADAGTSASSLCRASHTLTPQGHCQITARSQPFAVDDTTNGTDAWYTRRRSAARSTTHRATRLHTKPPVIYWPCDEVVREDMLYRDVGVYPVMDATAGDGSRGVWAFVPCSHGDRLTGARIGRGKEVEGRAGRMAATAATAERTSHVPSRSRAAGWLRRG